jgi:uncharacterized membrane protein
VSDGLLGVVAVALGVGLLLGHRYVDRQMAEAAEERLERWPLLRQIQEAAKRQSPRWLTSDGFTRGYNRFSLVLVGIVLAGIGIKLIVRAL